MASEDKSELKYDGVLLKDAEDLIKLTKVTSFNIDEFEIFSKDNAEAIMGLFITSEQFIDFIRNIGGDFIKIHPFLKKTSKKILALFGIQNSQTFIVLATNDSWIAKQLAAAIPNDIMDLPDFNKEFMKLMDINNGSIIKALIVAEPEKMFALFAFKDDKAFIEFTNKYNFIKAQHDSIPSVFIEKLPDQVFALFDAKLFLELAQNNSELASALVCAAPRQTSALLSGHPYHLVTLAEEIFDDNKNIKLTVINNYVTLVTQNIGSICEDGKPFPGWDILPDGIRAVFIWGKAKTCLGAIIQVEVLCRIVLDYLQPDLIVQQDGSIKFKSIDSVFDQSISGKAIDQDAFKSAIRNFKNIFSPIFSPSPVYGRNKAKKIHREKNSKNESYNERSNYPMPK